MSPGFEEQVKDVLEVVWRTQWPQEGPNFINPATVAVTFSQCVAAAIQAAIQKVDGCHSCASQDDYAIWKDAEALALAALASSIKVTYGR